MRTQISTKECIQLLGSKFNTTQLKSIGAALNAIKIGDKDYADNGTERPSQSTAQPDASLSRL